MTNAGAARVRDVGDAIRLLPPFAAWRRCAWIYLVFLVCAAPLGVASGLIHPSPPPVGVGAAILTALTIAVHPAFTEELVFRVFLLPRQAAATGRRRLTVAIAVSLVLFVAAHPLNARYFWPAALPTFTNPYYLVLAALLGAACTAAYLTSKSIWPPVLMHWFTVVVWLLFLGGSTLLAH